MPKIFWWIPFSINFLLYGVCCLLIIKRKSFSTISIRSPTLLLSTIIGNFLMGLVIILFKITGQNFFSSFYYLFRAVMIVSLFLRFERIILCCGINKNDEIDMKYFYKKRYLYIEKFYVKILMILFTIFLLVTIIIRAFKKEYLEVFYTNTDVQLDEVKIWIWVIWNFLEQILMITYLYRIYNIISPKQFIKFELYSFLIVWFIYSNFSFIFAIYNRDNMINSNNAFVMVSLAVLYISLILNGYLPLTMSFFSKTLVTYHFTAKLMNNLYLFLTDQTCYESFNDYLISKRQENENDNGPFLLKLYTHIMKFKLYFVLNATNRELGLSEANKLYRTFFEDETNSKLIDQVIVLKVKNECKDLQNNVLSKNIFDDALQYVFNELNKRFNDYKNSREYKELQAKISLASYIKCKMSNTGLINKF